MHFNLRSLEVKPGQLPPPGLNRQLITRITGGATPSLEQLEERKLAIVRLLSAEVMTPVEVVCPLIMASGDPKSRSAPLSLVHHCICKRLVMSRSFFCAVT